MEKDSNNKLYYEKKKVSNDKNFEDKKKFQKSSKISYNSSSQNLEKSKQLSYLNFGFTPVNIFQVKKFDKKEDIEQSKLYNFYDIIFQRKQEIKLAHKRIDELIKKINEVRNLINETYENIKKKKI